MADKKIVLAIDDNLQQLSEFKNILIPQFDLRVVKSASEAIVFLNKTHADVILLDIEMPNISGFDFLEDIRKIPSYISTPIIIVSGSSGIAFVEKAQQSTAAEVLNKPINPRALVQAIEKSLAEQK
jgi:CheY-like chemotaxis protein